MARALSAEGWQRNVWALTLIVFIAYVGFQFNSPFLPLFVHELGVSDPRSIALWSGVLSAVTPAVSGLLGPVFGRLADRFGRKVMLIRSLAAFVVIIAVMGVVTSVQQLFVARLVQGLFAGFTPMAMALASVSAPRDKVPTAIGMVQSAQLLSVAVGPAAGGYVASHFGIRSAFFVTAGMCAVALIVLVVLFDEVSPDRSPSARAGVPRLPLAQVFRYPHFPVVLAMLLIAQFLDRGLSLLIPLEVARLTSEDAIRKDPETLKKSLRAIFRALRFMKEHPEEAAAIAAKRLGWTPEAVLRAHKISSPLFPFDGSISVQALGSMQEVLLEYGVIKKRLPLEEHFTKDFTPVKLV